MEAFLTWVFEDEDDLKATSRVLAFFKEKQILDAMGVGSITAGLSDQLFPGTSTTLTRLRYMLFIPWIYQHLERLEVPPARFGDRVAAMERRLIKPLSEDPDHGGVFGSQSGEALKTMPSSLYWRSLWRWGVRRAPLTQRSYHRRVGGLYLARRRADDLGRQAEKLGDDADRGARLATLTWHPAMPGPPDGFPDRAGTALTYPEAEFLANRIKERFSGSLFAFLALEAGPSESDHPWTHPDHARFSADHKELLRNARLMSDVIAGADVLYSLQLAGLKESPDLVRRCADQFDGWLERLPLGEVRSWEAGRLWDATIKRGFKVPHHARLFFERWLGMVKADPAGLAGDPAALDLVRSREIFLKGPRSRFRNRRALDQWNGDVRRHGAEYRWSTVKVLLADLRRGLEEGAGC